MSINVLIYRNYADIGQQPEVLDMRAFGTYERQIQEKAFEGLLRAIYTQPSDVDCEILIAMTDLADYYCALPILSRALNSALLKVNFTYELLDNPLELLSTSIKLRNPLLFKDCLNISLGPWDNPVFTSFTDPKIVELAKKAYDQISNNIKEINEAFHEFSTRSKYNSGITWTLARDLRGEFAECAKIVRWSLENEGKEWSTSALPQIYQTFCRSDFGRRFPLTYMIRKVLENNMTLGKRLVAGQDQCWDRFLCAEIDDRDLPWDRTQEDW